MILWILVIWRTGYMRLASLFVSYSAMVWGQVWLICILGWACRLADCGVIGVYWL